VRVHGASRAALWIAALLTSAGIGLVVSTGPTPARQAQDIPDPPEPPGLPGGATARPTLTRPATARSARGSAAPRTRPRRSSLVILADSHRRDLPAALARDQVPHLAVSTSEAIGVVGPLVLPGRSACLRCLDLTRAERDPAWPLILAQLAGRAAPDPAACDAVLAAMALAFIDRGPAAVAVICGTLELVRPDWQWRRRTWPPHPRCGCRT